MGLSVKFYLESKAKAKNERGKVEMKKLLPIFLYVRHKGSTFKLFTERKCNWHAWEKVKGRVNSKKLATATEINGFLSNVEEEVTNCINYNSRKGMLTTKDEILGILAELNGAELKRLSLIDFAQDYVDKSTFAPNTKKGYQTTLNALKEYSSKKRIHLAFTSIDLNFYDSYTSYLWKEKKLNDNTVGTHIKHIKTLMNEAFERDLHNNLKFKKKGFVVMRKDSDSVYLSEAEIDKLLALDLSEDKKLERVRDIFCIDCWLGLRYSDLVRVTKDKIIEENGITLLKIEMTKTNSVVRVPINPKAIPLLTKYDYTLPAISSQKFNSYLKEITKNKKAGLNSEIEITTLKAGQKERTRYPKHELITSHTARRSFATNLYLQGVSSQHIMAVTGHKTEKAFRAYIRLSDMEKIKVIDNHFKSQAKLKIA